MKIKGKLLAAAIALLGLSTAGSVAGTVAWFTAANTVSVSNMFIQAQVEEGIIISNEAKSLWKTSAEASHDGTTGDPAVQAAFVPTSTKDVTNWWHAYSQNADDANENAKYDAITPVDNIASPALGAEGDGIFGYKDGSAFKNVYLLNKFYVKASGKDTIDDQDIYITNMKALVSSAAPSQELSKGLRIAIKAAGESNPLIFAPVSDADATNTIALTLKADKTIDTSTVVTNITDDGDHKIKDNYDIPNYDDATGLEFSVYIYFEGTDTAVKSSNIPSTTLERIGVTFDIKNSAHPTI